MVEEQLLQGSWFSFHYTFKEKKGAGIANKSP
jgi:hypothetical protein